MFGRGLIRRGKRNGTRELAHPIAALREEMNRLFEDFFSETGEWALEPFAGWATPTRALMPKVNVSETDKEVRVTAELPGVDEKDLEVTVTRNTLTIRGEKRQEHEEEGESYYRVERSFGSFERTIPLPAEVETDKVDAKFSKGVLTVTLPKTKEAQEHAKRVKVKTE